MEPGALVSIEECKMTTAGRSGAGTTHQLAENRKNEDTTQRNTLQEPNETN